jgi:hypothetical protein
VFLGIGHWALGIGPRRALGIGHWPAQGIGHWPAQEEYLTFLRTAIDQYEKLENLVFFDRVNSLFVLRANTCIR